MTVINDMWLERRRGVRLQVEADGCESTSLESIS
jgi:hypothetical protein